MLFSQFSMEISKQNNVPFNVCFKSLTKSFEGKIEAETGGWQCTKKHHFLFYILEPTKGKPTRSLAKAELLRSKYKNFSGGFLAHAFWRGWGN
jgi:hypothetical protein